MDKQGMEQRRNQRSDQQVQAAIDRLGSLEALVQVMSDLRLRGVGWQRLAEMTGVNRYACRVLVEEGRVPGGPEGTRDAPHWLG